MPLAVLRGYASFALSRAVNVKLQCQLPVSAPAATGGQEETAMNAPPSTGGLTVTGAQEDASVSLTVVCVMSTGTVVVVLTASQATGASASANAATNGRVHHAVMTTQREW